MAPHSSTLAWKIPWTEEPGGLQSMGSLRVGHDWVSSLSRIEEGNGNPLQCSCLENPRDRGASWAANCGMAQSQTRLKRLSSSSSKLAKWPYERGDSPWGSWQRQRDAYSKLDGARLFNRQNGEKQEGWELSARPLECQSLVGDQDTVTELWAGMVGLLATGVSQQAGPTRTSRMRPGKLHSQVLWSIAWSSNYCFLTQRLEDKQKTLIWSYWNKLQVPDQQWRLKRMRIYLGVWSTSWFSLSLCRKRESYSSGRIRVRLYG